MAEFLRQGDVGTAIRCTIKEKGVVVPIDNATIKKMRFQKPSGAAVEKTAVLSTDGLDGRLQYVTEVGFLDEPGPWMGEGYVELPSGKWTSTQFSFNVQPIIATT